MGLGPSPFGLAGEAISETTEKATEGSLARLTAPQGPRLRTVQTPQGRRKRRDEEFDLFGTLLAGLPSRQGALAAPSTTSTKTVLG